MKLPYQIIIAAVCGLLNIFVVIFSDILENSILYLILLCIDILVFIILYISKKPKYTNCEPNEQAKELYDARLRAELLFFQTVAALSDAVDAKDRYTSGHSKRVAQYAYMIAVRMHKSTQEQKEIYCAGLLHDVGKIRIPEELINKPARLTEEEFEIMKIHPITGYHILKGISEKSTIAQCAKFHHERYDGNGYPNRLKGKSIPEYARIIGVADAYDAMASNRSYRTALPQEVVRREIAAGRGTQFDPEIADIMLEMIDEDTNYTMKQKEPEIKNILAADTDAENISKIKSVMQDEPTYRIFGAATGEEIINLLEKEKFDLVLLDINMQSESNNTLLGTIREHYMVPVIFMTDGKNLHLLHNIIDLGTEDYISKP